MVPGVLAAAGAAVLAVAAALALHVAVNCPIQPLPSPRRPPSPYPPNNLLQRVEKLGEGLLKGPEDVYVDAAAGGTLYTAARDGWLHRMHPNGTWERWRFVGGDGLLGIFPSADGSMLVCDSTKGLLKVGEGGVTLLASHDAQGSRISFANAVVEASDGKVYFSDLSSRFHLGNWFLGFIEARPAGRLLRYDLRTPHRRGLRCARRPRLRQWRCAVQERGLHCRLRHPEVCTGAYVKLWLKGDKTGQSETLVDNLPGCPDNIHLAPDGSFWIALSSPLLDLIGGSTIAKRVLASFPAFHERAKAGLRKRAMVAQVSESGDIVRLLDDSEGKVLGRVTSATEFDGNLYIGSLGANFVGKLVLPQQATQEQSAVLS
ncbi:hypothetical protein ACP70R_046388 [Stipagrostis hirtigluma subsp. patula]